MRLVQKHIIKQNNEFYKDLMEMMHLSKNLYNAALYNVRQYYFKVKDDTTVKYKYLNYYANWRLMMSTQNSDFKALPNHIAQQVIRQVDNNFSSFFALLKKKNRGMYTLPVQMPQYLKTDGYNQIIIDQWAKAKLKEGYLQIPTTKILIKVGLEVSKLNIKQIRLVPKNSFIVLEFIHEVPDIQPKTDNKRYMSIDLGINNLCSCSSNVVSSFIVNGKPVKSINQFYNKQLAKYKSICETVNKCKTSKRIKRLNYKRTNKIEDYFHKVSRYIVNQLVSNDINTLVIGHNNYWKQDTKLGKKINQNFIQIPFNKLIQMLSYKCKLLGINCVIQEESYTSKASFIDNDHIPVFNSTTELNYKFSGKRVKRGLYCSQNGIKINADINGSLNILRKYLKVNSDDLFDINSRDFRGFVYNPKVINIQ